MKRYLFFVLLGSGILLMPARSFGQLLDFGVSFDEALKGGGEDMSTYMENYTRPFINGFGTGIANGWYNTAAPHSTLGFDLTFYMSLVRVPDEELVFDFVDSEYSNLSLASGSSSVELPTILGESTQEELVSSFSEGGITVTSTPFAAPSGFGEDLPTTSVPVPMLQFALGLPKGFELIGRYTPAVSNDDLELSYFGVGLKHDIKQWIPGVRLAPFDLSVLIGYTSLDMEVFMNNAVIPGSDDRSAVFDVSALTFQALASKQVSVLTVYGALGYNAVNSNFSMLGDYELVDSGNPSLSLTLTDPVNLDYTINGLRATAGIRLKFAVFTLHADYTLQKYNTITAGIGISVR